VNVFRTATAFASVRDNGSVIVWGQSGSGGDLGGLSPSAVDGSSFKVISVVGSDAAFSALRENGSVVTWGSGGYGGNSLSVATKINGVNPIVGLYSNRWSFVAVYADGQFVTWGDSTYGGDSSAINPN
jgi:hypothetical protein